MKLVKNLVRHYKKQNVIDLFLIRDLPENEIQEHIIYILSADQKILAVVKNENTDIIKHMLHSLCGKRVYTYKQLQKAIRKVETPKIKENKIRGEFKTDIYNEYINNVVNDIFNANRYR